MTTGNTSLLGLALPIEGELDGTWGDVVNDSITSLLDSAVAGTTTLSTDADVTLTDTSLAANQSRQAILLWTASNGATTRNITAPARSKAYIVINAGTGSVVLRGDGIPPTTGVTIVSGEKCLAGWNGSDFVKIASTAISNLTGILAVANGGSGTATPALVQGTGITISGSWPNQTITANNAGTVTSVTGTAPVVSSGGATPAISMAAATASVNGYMTSTYAAKLDGIAAGATNVTNTNQLTNGANFITSGGALGTPSSGNLANCTFPTLNQNTTGTAASTPKLLTTNFTIEESGGKLVFKYGGTTIASMDSSGNFVTAADTTAFGTP